MEYFTELLGKQVVSIFEKQVVGTLYNIDIDFSKKRVRNLIILSDDEETFYLLPPHKIYSTSDCITIRNNADLIISVEPEIRSIIGLTALGLSGKNYSKINEIAFDNWRPQLFYTIDPFDINLLLGISKQIVLLNDLKKKVFFHNFKSKKTAVPEVAYQTVSILESVSSVSMPKTITAQNAKNR